MEKRKLRWRDHSANQFQGESSTAICGQYEVSVDYDPDAAWTYTIEVGCSTVREFGDYIRSFGTKEKAKEAAEKWLLNQLAAMNRAFKGRGLR